MRRKKGKAVKKPNVGQLVNTSSVRPAGVTKQIIDSVAEATARIGDKQIDAEIAQTKSQQDFELRRLELEAREYEKSRVYWAQGFAGFRDLLLTLAPVVAKVIENKQAAHADLELRKQAQEFQAAAKRQKAQHDHEARMQSIKKGKATFLDDSGDIEESAKPSALWTTPMAEKEEGGKKKKVKDFSPNYI